MSYRIQPPNNVPTTEKAVSFLLCSKSLCVQRNASVLQSCANGAYRKVI